MNIELTPQQKALQQEVRAYMKTVMTPQLLAETKIPEFKEGGGMPEATIPRVPKSGGPHGEWVRAVKGDGPEPGSNFEYSARMTEVVLLGVIAQRFGGKIEYDPKKGKITKP